MSAAAETSTADKTSAAADVKHAPAYLLALSQWLEQTRFEDLPTEVVDRARLVTLDSLGAIAGGSAEPEVRALTEARLADASSGTGESGASVVGTGRLAATTTAAFLNGTAGTFLEMDEGNQFCRGHPGIHAVPAALALSEAGRRSGQDFMLAMVLGYEVGARIGIAASLRMSMHPHGTWGTVGAAVAAASLGGATADEFRETINVASTLGLGTSRQTMLQGGTVRNAFAGVSGQLGIMAFEMVRAGFTGERDGLATIWGEVQSERWEPAAMTDALGQRYEIARNYFKLHSCCRYNHASLDALGVLCAEHTFAADDIATVDVETYSLAAQLNDRAPVNTLGAKFSLPFAIASTLVNGSSDVASFTWDAVKDKAIRDLALRVSVVEDPALTARMPRYRPARVSVTLQDGRTLTAATDTNRGDTEDPYSVAEIHEKFRSLAIRAWSTETVEQVLTRAMAVDSLNDLRGLL